MTCPPHPAERVEMRRKKAVGGGSVFRLQCQSCGDSVGGPVSLQKVNSLGDPRKVKLWNTRLAHQPNPTARRREYLARFKRADWRKLRRLVLERDHYTCQECSAAATEAHHLTYERFGAERLTDLAASCRDCNLREREERITSRVLGT
jgi:5-methylcytosine-specific restriction endonuclease McrA